MPILPSNHIVIGWHRSPNIPGFKNLNIGLDRFLKLLLTVETGSIVIETFVERIDY
jgi:hypothetical protein